jgi:hypothetical protein
MMALVHCSLFRGVAFREDWISGAVLVVFGLLLQGIDHYRGTFSVFLFLF